MTTNTAESATAGVPVVRGLVWEDADEGMCTKWRAAALGGNYELVAFEGEDGFAVNFHWGRPLSFWFIQGDPDEWGPTGPKMFPDLDEAKAAAQADYDQRILSTINPDYASAIDTARAEIERLRERLRDATDERDNLSAIVATEIDDVAGAELDDLEERAITAESALTAAQERIAELEGALGSVEREYVTEYAGRSYTRCTCCHVALSDGQPHLTNCAWTTLSPAVKEPK